MTDDTLKLSVVHQTDRRVRMTFDDALGRDGIQAVANRLAGLPGVKRALVRPNTGSVILETDLPAGDVMREISGENIAQIVPRQKPPPVSQTLQMGLLGGDMAVRRSTDGTMDLRTAIALLLTFAAIVQLFRGRLVGPAATLLLGAMSLIEKGGSRR